MKNILPFGTAVTCDVCRGSGKTESGAFVCPMCHGIGEIRVPKAVEGPKDHPLNYHFPKFDYGRFLGQLEILTENLRAVEALGYAITQDLKDAEMDELANGMLAAQSQASEKARQLYMRAERLKGR